MKWSKSLYIVFALVLVLPLFYEGQAVFAQLKVFPKTVSKIPATGKKKNSTRLNQAERQVQFIGAASDALIFGNADARVLSEYAGSVSALRSGDEPANADSGIVIIIDTNQVIGVEENNFINKIASTSKFDAYPVIVKNISGKKLIVGSGVKVPVYVEALDKNNDWRTIENDWTNTSTVGNEKVILKPGDIIGLGIPISSGNFKTLLRLRILDNYSEPFTGYINLSQFSETGK